jgi:hypothetical protein
MRILGPLLVTFAWVLFGSSTSSNTERHLTIYSLTLIIPFFVAFAIVAYIYFWHILPMRELSVWTFPGNFYTGETSANRQLLALMSVIKSLYLCDTIVV